MPLAPLKKKRPSWNETARAFDRGNRSVPHCEWDLAMVRLGQGGILVLKVQPGIVGCVRNHEARLIHLGGRVVPWGMNNSCRSRGSVCLEDRSFDIPKDQPSKSTLCPTGSFALDRRLTSSARST
eukprot:scaffold741_cov336-Pavlova_lutheri.AAC.17